MNYMEKHIVQTKKWLEEGYGEYAHSNEAEHSGRYRFEWPKSESG